MKTQKMLIEIYLFVNPLGRACYQSEKTIAEFAKERNEKVRVRFVPFLNFQTISKQLEEENIKGAGLELRNQMYTDSYRACLGFAAASMQGKKMGRTFLLALQEAVIGQKQPVTLNLFEKIAEDIGLDMEMFQEDLDSEWSKSAFLSDQKLAREMNIQDTPSCVIYLNSDKESGYMIDSVVNKQLLHGLCEAEQTASEEAREAKKKYHFQFV